MSQFKLYAIEYVGPTVVVRPLAADNQFRYQHLQGETNALRQMLATTGTEHLIVDLSDVEYFGSELIGALTSLLRDVRSRGGTSCLCGASSQMREVLANMNLAKVWRLYDDRAQALSQRSDGMNSTAVSS